MPEILGISQRLRPHLGKIVRLRFKDGEVVEAKIITVDDYDDGELIYDLVRRVAPPVPERSGAQPGTACLAQISELDALNPVEA